MANEKRRLVDLDRVIERLKKAETNMSRINGIKCVELGSMLNFMETQPTVEAVEVVHAYWTGSRFNPMTDEYEEYCSHCCAWSAEYGKPYCPNCGAKMDGGTQDGE